ncbi:MAG: CopG family transcriptional regulator [Acidobacteria bacterium]|nr:CopG family transcriptional regulator [Acidobacteriota bacterium]
MPRTIISLSDEDKTRLDQEAAAQRVSMTEIVRRAVREYLERHGDGRPRPLDELLVRTRGCWAKGDGLVYQNALRDEWGRRR